MALQTQIKQIEESAGKRMEPCLVDVLEGLELLRSENASVDDVGNSWLDSITKTVWADAGLGTSPGIDRFIIECGNSAAIIYLGHRVRLEDWATGRAEPVVVPRGSHIHQLLDWALSPFYEQLWEKERL